MEEEALYKLVCIECRCPQCQGETREIEKTTVTGRELREWQCKACGWTHVFDCGEALWKILSDANKELPNS
jgi:rubredoxin